eukprot:EG_transcript_20438
MSTLAFATAVAAAVFCLSSVVVAGSPGVGALYATPTVRPAPTVAQRPTLTAAPPQPMTVLGAITTEAALRSGEAPASPAGGTPNTFTLALASAITGATAALTYTLGRLVRGTVRNRSVEAQPLAMLAMGAGDDDDNDLFGLLGLAETAGLPGAIQPLGYFDPLKLSQGKDFNELKKVRESELKHGRVAMLAVVGLPLAEQFHPLFGGAVDGPGVQAVLRPELAVFWLLLLPLFYFLEQPTLAAYDTTGKLPGLFKEAHKPGDYGFDPLSLKPATDTEYEAMQCKELSNGRLAMVATLGMLAQEVVTSRPLF